MENRRDASENAITAIAKFLTMNSVEASDVSSKPEGLWNGVGNVSDDRTAIVCNDNWLDIFEGINDYLGMYRIDTEKSRNLCQKWLDYDKECRT